MILNNFFRPLHIFPMLLGHQEALPKHLHHSWSQSIQFPENWHICLKTGQVILQRNNYQFTGIIKTKNQCIPIHFFICSPDELVKTFPFICRISSLSSRFVYQIEIQAEMDFTWLQF